MSTIPIPTVTYIKPHPHYQEYKSRFHAILGYFFNHLFAKIEGMTTFAVVIFIAALFFLVFMKFGEVGAITDFYCNTCNSLPAVFVAP
jgi:hypothetical protein